MEVDEHLTFSQKAYNILAKSYKSFIFDQLIEIKS